MKAISMLMTGLILCLSVQSFADAQSDFEQAAKASAEVSTERKIDALIAAKGCSTKLVKPMVRAEEPDVLSDIYYVTTTNCTCQVVFNPDLLGGNPRAGSQYATCYKR